MNSKNIEHWIKEEHGWIAILTLILSIGIYWSGANYTYTNWDDSGYTVENPLLAPDTSFGTIMTSYWAGNYHPLTILSYRLDTQISGTIEAFHKTNIILHLLNIIFLFFVLRLLKVPSWMASLVLIAFALHPMRVENVIWISARKDVLSMFFGLISWAFYLLFTQSNKQLYNLLCLVAFILAILSKGAMAFLPIVFIASHYFLGRSLKYNLGTNISLLLISIAAGITAIFAQAGEQAIFTSLDYSILERAIIIPFGIARYMWSFFVPIGLSALYPYPNSTTLYSTIYIGPAISLFVVAFIAFKKEWFNRYFVLGAIIFFASLAMYLQVVPVGAAYIADRYSYFAFIGLTLMLGGILNTLVPKADQIGLGLSLILLLVFSSMTYMRIPVWENSITLWEDVHSKYPDHALVNNNLGASLKEQGQNSKAIPYLDKALELRQDYHEAYYNRAQALYFTKKNELAILDINKAILFKNDVANYYQTRASIYMKLNRREEAFSDFNTAIKLDPTDASYYNNRGILYKKYNRMDEAIADFSQAIILNPGDPVAYYSRANTYVQMTRFADAIPDFTAAISLNPEFGEAYFNRSFCYFSAKNYVAALSDYEKAVGMGVKPNEDYRARLDQVLKPTDQ